MSSQDVGRSPSFKSILLPAESRSQNTLPSPFSHTVASIRDGVGTQWIFYYNVQSIISYEKIPAHEKPTRSQLIIDGKPVVGGPNDSVAATSALDSPRLYFIDQNFILRELVGPKTSDAWAFGAVPAGNSPVYVNSALISFGVSGGNLPTGVRLPILFHETGEFP